MKLFTFVLLGILSMALFASFPRFSIHDYGRAYASASSDFPAGDAEYANGTIGNPDSDLLIWYDWINVSGTQVIYYVLYTNSDYHYPTPIANLLVQHLQLSDGTEVFVVSALSAMEVYKDQNGDGIPQANFTSGTSEILYWMFINMSDSYNITPIQKTIEGTVPHYQWGFTYINVYAYLINTTGPVGVVAKLILDHLTISYDFSVNSNVSDLKTNFDIGKVTDMTVLDSSHLSLDGLSLALLFPTCTYASQPYSTYVDDQPYNSTNTNDTAVEAEVARVAVSDTKAYDFVFGGNYTLTRGENNETYPVKAEAAALSSIPIDTCGPVMWRASIFADELNLSNFFGGSWPDVTLDYGTSPLIYRICFPVWDGMQIRNDPVFVGYLFSSTQIPEIPAIAIFASMFIAATLLVLRARLKKKEY